MIAPQVDDKPWMCETKFTIAVIVMQTKICFSQLELQFEKFLAMKYVLRIFPVNNINLLSNKIFHPSPN